MNETRKADVLRMQRDDGTMYRAAAVTVATPDEETQTRSVSLAISSEAPVLRYDYRTGDFFYEVLAHDASAVDLSRAQNGLPLLRGHDERDVVGRARNITVDADSVLRAADVTFSRSEDGRAAMMDVEDGILTDTSVGYVVGDQYTEEKRDGDEFATRTYTRWTPFEVSLVAVPADPSVGVGRSANAPVIRITTTQEHTVDEQNTASATVEARAEAIKGICAGAGVSIARMDSYIASGKSAREVGAELMGELAARNQEQAKPVTLTEAEEREYSIVNAINAAATGTRSFELEVSDEIAKSLGRQAQQNAFFMPTTGKAFKGRAEEIRTQLSLTAGAGKGGESKFTEFGSFIEMLRARLVLSRLGVTFLGGLQGAVGFPQQTAAGAFSWGNDATAPGLSSLSLQSPLRTMDAKVGSSRTTFSRTLLRQSSIGVENLVRNDLLNIHAQGIEIAAINGAGGTAPRGILQTAGIGAVALGTNGAVPTYDSIVNLESEVTQDNADVAAMNYLTTARGRGQLKRTQVFTGTNGVPVWQGGIDGGEMNGYGAYATNNVPSNLVKGSSGAVCHAVIFGAWSQMIVGEWGAAEIMVNPFVAGSPQLIEVSSFQLLDVFVRYPESFAAITDMLVN
jgi:HK97 family phage major capsid protein/HK97 family phage prohead protease